MCYKLLERSEGFSWTNEQELSGKGWKVEEFIQKSKFFYSLEIKLCDENFVILKEKLLTSPRDSITQPFNKFLRM